MAEQEVIKHTRNTIKVLRDPEKNWWRKLKEVILEILIIVFKLNNLNLHLKFHQNLLKLIL